MKKLKTLATIATLTATMAFTNGAQAIGGPVPVEICNDLSRQVDSAYSDYLAAIEAGSHHYTILGLKRKYDDINSVYNSIC